MAETRNLNLSMFSIPTFMSLLKAAQAKSNFRPRKGNDCRIMSFMSVVVQFKIIGKDLNVLI